MAGLAEEAFCGASESFFRVPEKLFIMRANGIEKTREQQFREGGGRQGSPRPSRRPARVPIRRGKGAQNK